MEPDLDRDLCLDPDLERDLAFSPPPFSDAAAGDFDRDFERDWDRDLVPLLSASLLTDLDL